MIKRAAAGEQLRHDEVKAIIASHKPAAGARAAKTITRKRAGESRTKRAQIISAEEGRIGNGGDSGETAEAAKAQYAAAEAAAETEGEAKPDQEVKSATSAEEEEHRKYLRQIEMEKIQADPENREILCCLLRNHILDSYFAKVTPSEIFNDIPYPRRREVFGDIINIYTAEELLGVLTPKCIAKLRALLAEPKPGKPNAKGQRKAGVQP
jgi:hypothetical protein